MNGLSTTSTLDEMHGHGFALGGEVDRERAFRRAMRHSRRVRRLRVAIPVVIVAILSAMALVRWLDPLRVLVRLPTDAGRLVISGTKITMEAPKLSGYTRDSRWYELTARAAAQDITKPNIIELHGVRAKVEAEDKSTMHLSATEGTFDRKAGVLTLVRDILLKSTNGYEMQLEEAVVETGTGVIVSRKPVEVRTQQGTINANELEVSKAGEIVRFGGGVLVDLPAGMGDVGGPPASKP
jgi:lipopolysaccharide export system protein LptC